MVSDHGIVASQSLEAARAGAGILAAGGNAVDAAVATGLALAATEPWMSGLGGGGYMMVHSAQDGGTRVVAERSQADDVRDLKLDHSFKIVQVQVRVVEEERAKGAAANQDTINRALETIAITSTNARDMIKSSGDSDEPVAGTIID